MLAGQRQAKTGSVDVHGTHYHATRREMLEHKVFHLPEEPLRNASVASMTLAENLAFRGFDQPPLCRRRWVLSQDRMKDRARQLVARYRIKAANVDVPIEQLSGETFNARFSPGSYLPASKCLLPRTLVLVSTSERLPKSTVRSWPLETVEPPCCWSARTWTNSWLFPIASL